MKFFTSIIVATAIVMAGSVSAMPSSNLVKKSDNAAACASKQGFCTGISSSPCCPGLKCTLLGGPLNLGVCL
ncbi:hypothetical protein QCA50_002641 [Cerrena zonata]|uniref:Uncharacterized protein n=1 Tax=Cerrena zonata TaxID=2478898 RepID=A0AAW0GUF9_9APHY